MPIRTRVAVVPTRAVALGAVVGLVLGAFACELGPKSGWGLRLPPGDVARGEVAFRELGCARCHDIAGEPAGPAGDGRDGIVVLGGDVTRVETHGELVTSIVNPSHEVSRRYREEDAAGVEASRMKSQNDRMTVSQLIDLTEYLQSKYELRPDPFHP